MRRVSQAVVLHSSPIGERDLLVSLLSRDWGLLRAVAKGARKSKRRFVNVLEPFSYLRVHLRAGKPPLLPFLDQADLLEPFEPLRLNPRLYVLASYLVELVESFFRPQTGREFFPILLESLQRLAEGELPVPLLKGKFELKILQISGFWPSLEECVRCQKEVAPPVAFSFRDGGLVCASCRFEEDLSLSAPAWALLKHLCHASFLSLGRIRIAPNLQEEALKVIEDFVRRTLDREINALRVLKEMV